MFDNVNDIVILIGAIVGGIATILKLSRCEQISICKLIKFKRTPKNNNLNLSAIGRNESSETLASIETIQV